ncbi:MAG: 4'-phosphopantetheinyl transferase superfamily protein [Tannerellaceae bacterium]|nr:4'-phosphopantetheinyl transferase superfamily protein [Tannerellaceae bacterium]
MPLLFKQTDTTIRGVWKIEENVEELLACFADPVPYITSLKEKKSDSRQKEWLAVRVLLKELTGKELCIAYHTNGAPYLTDSPYYISISHTKEYVAIILHPEYPVGIDIEYISERVCKIRDRFMSPEEIRAVDPANEVCHLLLYWCAKETLFKVIGKEEVDFREMLHIEPFPYRTSGEFTGYETCTSLHKKYVIHYLVTDGFVLTYTT